MKVIDNFASTAAAVLDSEIDALAAIKSRINNSLDEAIKTLLNAGNKVVVSGMGKSGHVAQKLVASLCSTGTPAVFLHPAEAIHGDLGVYTPGDPTLLISNSGTTPELMRLIPILKNFESPIVSILGQTSSPIASRSDVVLDASVSREADFFNIVPSSSVIAALAWGDILTCCLMEAKDFQKEDFAKFHPGGQLGRNLLCSVDDVMHPTEKTAQLAPDAPMKEVVEAMTNFSFGAACIVNHDNTLLGIITDGDIRRLLVKADNPQSLRAQEVMVANPLTAHPKMLLSDALTIMEDRPSQISVLPVVDPKTNQYLGLIRIHDIYQPTP